MPCTLGPFLATFAALTFLSVSALRRPMEEKFSKLYLSRYIVMICSRVEISALYNSTGCVCMVHLY